MVIVACLMIAGCQQWQEYQRQMAERQRLEDIQRCIDFGYAQRSPKHADCMLQLYRDQQAEERLQQEAYQTERLIRAMKEKDCTRKRYSSKGQGEQEVPEKIVCK